MNFVVVILDSLFKTGKSGTQWYCVLPGTFSVPWSSGRALGSRSEDRVFNPRPMLDGNGYQSHATDARLIAGTWLTS